MYYWFHAETFNVIDPQDIPKTPVSNQEKFLLLNSFITICERYGVADGEIDIITQKPNFRHLVEASRGWTEESNIELDDNTFLRMLLFSGLVNMLYNQGQGFDWFYQANDEFNGKSPWQLIEEHPNGILKVSELVAKQNQPAHA